MKFAYTGYDSGGMSVGGVVDAASIDEATEKLRKQSVFVVSLTESDESSVRKANARAKGKVRNPTKQVAAFAREMSVLVSTGTPIVDAILSLEKQASSDEWAAVVSAVRRKLEEGESLSVALGTRPDAFDSVFCSLVAAGESSGQLDRMLHRLAILTRKHAQIRSSVIGAMAYPVLLTVICLIVLGLMLGVVLPRFSGLFETLDTPLPASTKFLMAISSAVIGYWWIAMPLVVTSVVGLLWWVRTDGGRRQVQALMLALPRVGGIVRSFGTARTARLLGTLLEARVPMIEAIGLTRRATTNYRFVEMMNRAERMVTKGEPVSAALIESDLFVASAAQAVRNGEQTGRLAEVLVHIADYLDEENEGTIKALSTLLEPVIMIVLGGLVAFVAVSMFLPLFDLTASAGGH